MASIMAIDLYVASGSPPSWRVWLSLEHKQLPYQLHVLSFQAGDLKKPEYLAINPRGKVPSIVDDGFSLYESVAITEYLEQRYPDSGSPLLPRDPKTAAIARRLVQEVDHYYAAAGAKLLRQTLFNRSGGDGDPKEIAEALELLGKELTHLERAIAGDYLAGPLSVADYTLYPYLAMSVRIDKQYPQLGIPDRIGPKLQAWKKRIEGLPYFEKTIPPHWK
jgi:glutathione S-transferase